LSGVGTGLGWRGEQRGCWETALCLDSQEEPWKGRSGMQKPQSLQRGAGRAFPWGTRQEGDSLRSPEAQPVLGDTKQEVSKTNVMTGRKSRLPRLSSYSKAL
jgi:hypothetical protein